MVGGNVHAMFVECPDQLGGGLRTLSAQTVDILDNENLVPVKAISCFDLEIV